MSQSTVLNCSRKTALIIISTTIFLFVLIGCPGVFQSAGLTDEQAAEQTTQLKSALQNATTTAIADIQTGLSEGHDLKTIAIKTSTTFLWKIIAAAGTSVGVVLNGLLIRWLNTEKKITKALITGVEDINSKNVKKTIHDKALVAGIEPQLHKRVNALT